MWWMVFLKVKVLEKFDSKISEVLTESQLLSCSHHSGRQFPGLDFFQDLFWVWISTLQS